MRLEGSVRVEGRVKQSRVTVVQVEFKGMVFFNNVYIWSQSYQQYLWSF